MKTQTTIERRMLTYFGLIAAASFLVTLEFVYAIERIIPANSTGPHGDHISAASAWVQNLTSLRNKALTMSLVQAVVTLIVLIMFMRRISGPLQHLVDCARTIAEGNLSALVKVRTKDEIGLLGDTINGLTSNIQEVISFGQTSLTSIDKDMQEVLSSRHLDSKTGTQLRSIEGRLKNLEEMMNSFSLFPAPLESLERGEDR